MLTSAEHSTLVFLLSAIEAAPSKSSDLLTLAEKHAQASESFQTAVRNLRQLAGDQTALLARSEEMRRQLR